MLRENTVELLDDPSLPADVVAAAYRDLDRLHRWLGNTSAILRRLHAPQKNEAVRCVLDIGCGQGALLRDIRRRLGVEVVGFDLRPSPPDSPILILQGDAVADPLPRADVALAVCIVHHLSDREVVQLIRNVSRSCRRFIILDLVRHPLPLWLFRIFVSPFLGRINVEDGITSIRRAFTPQELRTLADEAVKGTPARVEQTVAPFWIRQIVDIRW